MLILMLEIANIKVSRKLFKCLGSKISKQKMMILLEFVELRFHQNVINFDGEVCFVKFCQVSEDISDRHTLGYPC